MKKDKKPTIEELLKRIEALENCLNSTTYLPVFTPPQPPNPQQYTTQPHYHNGMPCWNNPCVWC